MPGPFGAPGPGAQQPFEIKVLDQAALEDAVPALAALLLDCVRGGASVSFLSDLTLERAEGFWREVAAAASRDGRRVLAAQDAEGLAGTVQVIPFPMANKPHRAEVAKMLVHSRARRRGIGAALLAAAEVQALALGRPLLSLDTETGSAGEQFYRRLGWREIGVIPDEAYNGRGELAPTTLFYKRLDSGG